MKGQPEHTNEAMTGIDPLKLLARVVHSVSPDEGGGLWQAPEPQELEEWLTGYGVESLIGRGGMGAVYKVFHKGLQRACALKLLPSSVSLRPDFEERFLREARAMADLQHPHIAYVYDSGRSQHGHLYYVMEYVEGVDLRCLIDDGGLDHKTAESVILQVCEALEYAHGMGYIHRDIKPGNVLLDTDGQVKVVDFGIAKILDDQDVHGMDCGVTGVGEVMGTPGYMSPEQSSGAEVDHRTDIYALGVMLYEMLTGSLPQGNFEPPSQKSGVDERWDEIVMRALKQDPDQRYQSVDEFKQAIKEGGTPRVRANGFGRRMLVVLGLILIVTFYGVNKWGLQSNESPMTATLPALDVAYKNSLGMDLVPLHGTRVLFGQNEARWDDWDAFLVDSSYAWDAPVTNRSGDHPALNISWNDARAFCKWLTNKERAAGRIGPEMAYRLPSDQEWSKAAGLSLELGETPEQRSGKVVSSYPWGNQWPPPEKVAAGLDQGEVFDVVQSVRDSYQLMAGPMTPEKIEDYKRVSFALYRKPWKGKLHGLAGDFVPLPQFAGQVQVLATDKAVVHYWNDKTVVLLGLWMGHHAQWTLPRVGWQSANWADAEFRDFFVSKKWEGGQFRVWTPATWNASDGTWSQEGEAFPSGILGTPPEGLGNRQLLGDFSDGTLRFTAGEITDEGRPVLVFDGTLDRQELRKLTGVAYGKLQSLWYDEADALCLNLLPKYKNEWLARSRAVTEPPANQLGIRGLEGVAKEWVEDGYGSVEDNFRTLRGGSMRLRGRGPSLQEMKSEHGRVVDFVVSYAIPPEEELLSSYRQPDEPEARHPWYGFRVVLEIVR